MKVWRVEHIDTGKGPYAVSSNEGVYSMLMGPFDHGNMDTHPSPSSDDMDHDGLRGIWDYNHRHGFATFEKLMAWFEDTEALLDGNGYIIACYELPDNHVLVGRHQVIFNIEEAVRIR